MKKWIKRILVWIVLPLTTIAVLGISWQVNENTAAIANHQHEHTHEASE